MSRSWSVPEVLHACIAWQRIVWSISGPDALGPRRPEVITTGVTDTGGREILGLDVGDSEDVTFWRAFLTTTAGPRRGRGPAGPPTSTPDWSWH